jgi:large subunit ribosomal protein L9
MEIILMERVEKLGNMGQVVNVKPGFARNFLLRRGKALRATDANKAKFEKQRAELEALNATRREKAAGDSAKLNGQSFAIIRQAGESGQLFGSVSPRDIAEAASASGISVQRSNVLLDTPIKTIGMYTVRVALHPEVISTITLNVARSAAEAESQARGDDLTGPVSDRAEARAAAEALFAEEGEEAVAEDEAAA